MLDRKILSFALVLAAIPPGCVPLEKVTGRPCPCPEDGTLRCCHSTQSCIPETDDCPATFPPSSRLVCGINSHCGKGEICQSWRLPNGDAGGPRECRRDCSQEDLCAAGEVCQPTPSNGMELELLSLVQACLPEEPRPGCEQSGCADCRLSELNLRFCDEQLLFGCFSALHAECGLVCRRVQVQDCNPGRCEVGEDGALCVEPADKLSPCFEFHCDGCSPPGPGKSACEGDAVVACMALPFPAEFCDPLCFRHVQSCPAGNRCEEADGKALCVPIGRRPCEDWKDSRCGPFDTGDPELTCPKGLRQIDADCPGAEACCVPAAGPPCEELADSRCGPFENLDPYQSCPTGFKQINATCPDAEACCVP